MLDLLDWLIGLELGRVGLYPYLNLAHKKIWSFEPGLGPIYF